ncbi:MAG: hypothetical protein M3O70_01250, partial [Actinomycetota bacterium]|nr:hypothetical protein [Actinomycetota bacterium]
MAAAERAPNELRGAGPEETAIVGLSRREFMARGAMAAGGLALALGQAGALARPRGGAGPSPFGELVPDPGGLLD